MWKGNYPWIIIFKKIFVRRNESLKIEIPFDNNTFKSYDPETKQFFIKGGEYQLELAESAVETKLKGVVKLAKYYFDDAGFENIVVDTSNDFEHAFSEFVDSADRRGFHKDRRGLPYGLKMLLTIIMMAYFLIISGLFLLTDIADADKPIFTLLAGLIGVLTLIIGITYILRITKRHRAIKALEVNDTLTEVVEKVQCFEELAKVTYAEAVVKEEEPVEEEKQEEVEEVEAEIESLKGVEGDIFTTYELGDVMYDFTLTDTDGNVLNLYDLLEENKLASEMCEIIKLYPQVLVNVKIDADKKEDYKKD